MASVTYGQCVMANVSMAKVYLAKVLWQMKLSHSDTATLQKNNLTSSFDV